MFLICPGNVGLDQYFNQLIKMYPVYPGNDGLVWSGPVYYQYTGEQHTKDCPRSRNHSGFNQVEFTKYIFTEYTKYIILKEPSSRLCTE